MKSHRSPCTANWDTMRNDDEAPEEEEEVEEVEVRRQNEGTRCDSCS